MRRLSPTAIALLAAAGVLLLIVAALALRGRSGNSDRLSDEQAAGTAQAKADKPCGAQSTYDEIRRELFRQAAATRGRDAATYDRLAAYSTLVVDRPRLAGDIGDIGAVQCAAAIKLIVPPGVAVVGGRRQLEANARYTVQAAADGSGPAVTLSDVESIVVPLATLARTSDPAPAEAEPPAEAGGDELAPLPDEPEPAAPGATVPASPPPVTRNAGPSFDCALARTRSEHAVCDSPALAGLDREMAAFYRSAIDGAAPAQTQLLRSTRDRFLAYRDRCPTEACIAATYRGRITEIRDILDGRWRP